MCSLILYGKVAYVDSPGKVGTVNNGRAVVYRILRGVHFQRIICIRFLKINKQRRIYT